MEKDGVILNKNRLGFLFSVGESAKVISNIWIFLIIQICFVITYISSNSLGVLLLMVHYLIAYLIFVLVYKKYTETKNILFQRCITIRNLISQELYDGKKLTIWQQELDHITEFLKEQKKLTKNLSF